MSFFDEPKDIDPDIGYYAVGDHDRDDLPWPAPADAWFWSTGDQWIAVVADFHDDWWCGADPEDIAARPEPWRRDIADVPETGILVYRNAIAEIINEQGGR